MRFLSLSREMLQLMTRPRIIRFCWPSVSVRSASSPRRVPVSTVWRQRRLVLNSDSSACQISLYDQRSVLFLITDLRCADRCVVYMGSEDVRRQALNVFRMKMLGARVRCRSCGGGAGQRLHNRLPSGHFCCEREPDAQRCHQ
jgi:hypothetical protein